MFSRFLYSVIVLFALGIGLISMGCGTDSHGDTTSLVERGSLGSFEYTITVNADSTLYHVQAWRTYSYRRTLQEAYVSRLSAAREFVNLARVHLQSLSERDSITMR